MGKSLVSFALALPQLRAGRSKTVSVVASSPAAVAGSDGAERLGPDRVHHPDPAHAAEQAEPYGRGEAQLWDPGGYWLGPEIALVQQVRRHLRCSSWWASDSRSWERCDVGIGFCLRVCRFSGKMKANDQSLFASLYSKTHAYFFLI